MSLVDGQAGRLVIRGRDVEEFANGMPFEEIVALLIGDRLDDLPPVPALRRALGQRGGKRISCGPLQGRVGDHTRSVTDACG